MTTDRQKLNGHENREKSGDSDLSEQTKKTEYLTAKQLGQILQISESTIHKLRRTGKIPAVMLTDRLIRFNLKDVKHALRPAQQANHQHPEATHQQEPSPQLSFEDFFK